MSENSLHSSLFLVNIIFQRDDAVGPSFSPAHKGTKVQSKAAAFFPSRSQQPPFSKKAIQKERNYGDEGISPNGRKKFFIRRT